MSSTCLASRSAFSARPSCTVACCATSTALSTTAAGSKPSRSLRNVAFRADSFWSTSSLNAYQVKPVSVETPEGVSGDNTISMVKVTLKVQQKL